MSAFYLLSPFSSDSVFFFFLLQLTFSMVLYLFQVYSPVVRHVHNRNPTPHKSRTPLVPPTVIAVVLTVFPVLCPAPPGLLRDYQ